MFSRYGGFAVVHKVVFAFYEKVLDSDIIGPFFEDVDMARLVDHQTKFISQVMGGPATYSNEVLEQVHRNLQIDQTAFDEMTRLLEATLQEFEIDPADIHEVMAGIKARQPYIVTVT